MANDFTGDHSCVALFKMDNGALTTDSIGSNTLGNIGPVVSNATDQQEGTGCAYFEGADALGISDAGLDAGFPFRSADPTPNKNITLCLYFRQSDLITIDQSIAGKYDNARNERSWRLKIESDDNSFRWAHGFNNGGTFEQSAAFASPFVENNWYHGGFTLDEDDNYRARIYDVTNDQFLDVDLTGTFPNATSVTSADLLFGAHGSLPSRVSGFTGLKDEIAIFDEIKSTDDMDDIREGTYGAPILLPINLTADDLTTGAPDMGTPTLGQTHILAADDFTAGVPTLGSPALGLTHTLIADDLVTGVPVLGSPSLNFVAPETPPERIYSIPYENRIYPISHENRIYPIPHENRTLTA